MKVAIIYVLLILLVVTNVAQYAIYSESADKVEVLTLLLSTEAEVWEISEDSTRSVEHYNYAVEAYDYGEYGRVIENCKQSRSYSSDYTNALRLTKANIKDREEKIFFLYNEIIQENIKIYENLYEACEYLESASRQYEVEDYVGGGDNIELMNEKIEAHDKAVRKHNDLIGEYKLEILELSK